MFNFATYLARLGAVVVFLKSNAFELLGLEVEKIYLMSEKRVKGLGVFLIGVLALPIGLVAAACLSGWLLGEVLGNPSAAMLAAGIIKVAAFVCGAGLLVIWVRAVAYAHLLVFGSQLGTALVSAFTGAAGKVLDADLKVSAESPLSQKDAEKFAAWLRRIIFWAETVCVLVMILPIWRAPGATMVMTVAVFALAMVMSRFQSERPYKIAMAGHLLMIGAYAFSMLFPVLTDRALQWSADAVGMHERASEVAFQKKLDELRAEDLAITQRGLKAEKTFASAEDEARHAAIMVLIPEYEARLHYQTVPTPPKTPNQDTSPQVSEIAASESVQQEVATMSQSLEEPPEPVGIAALAPPEPDPASSDTRATPKPGFDIEKAKAVLREYGRL